MALTFCRKESALAVMNRGSVWSIDRSVSFTQLSAGSNCERVKLLCSIKKTSLKDAIRTAHGKVDGEDLVVACMDFSFIGGSMGSVVGEKIARSIDYCLKNRIPLMIISKSGGARMMEAAFSLMQMAKTAAKLT